MTLKVKFWYFLIAPHYSNFQNLVISFEYSWFLDKNFSNFVSFPWKLHHQKCHSVHQSALMCFYAGKYSLNKVAELGKSNLHAIFSLTYVKYLQSLVIHLQTILKDLVTMRFYGKFCNLGKHMSIKNQQPKFMTVYTFDITSSMSSFRWLIYFFFENG